MLAGVIISAQQDEELDDVLEVYARHRKTDQALITGFTDSVIKLFSTDNAALSVMRNSGLLMLDNIPLLKNEFARQAMGLGAPIARLKVS